MAAIIITGVDGSQTASLAARRAAELTQVFRGELYVISAYGTSETRTLKDGDSVDQVLINHVADAERAATEVATELRRDFPTLTIEPSAVQGRPADALVRAATRLDSELIVVGNKRVQGISRILGSIARSVASAAPCDTYIVNTHDR